jgi:site-specific DNA recombinase
MARYGYERLSQDRSLRRINVTIQRDEIDDCALDSGTSIKQHFSDNNKSASEYGSKPRDGYIDLVATIMRSVDNEDEIIVTEIPRLCRKSEEALELIRLSKTTPLRYITTTDGMKYDLHTPRGRKGFREAVSDAEFESDQTSTRQHRKKNKLAEAGAFHGGQRPYGYEGAKYEQLVDADGNTYKGRLLNPGRVGTVIVEEEAAVRREATNRIIAGEREVDLVRDFNSRGITNCSGGKWRMGGLKAWLMRKRDVAFDRFPGPGTRIHKGKEYAAIWPAIISKEDYELMATAFKIRSSDRRKRDTIQGRQYLLSGILRSGHSGAPMYGRRRKLSDGTFERRYITVPQNGYGEKIAGPKLARKAEPLDEWVTEAVLEAFDTPEVASTLAPPENKQRIKELIERRAKQQLHLQQLLTDYGTGVLSRDDLVIAKQAAQQVLSETDNELAKIQAARTVSTIPAGETLREFMATASIELRRQVIQLAVDYVVVKPGHPRNAMWREHRFNPDHVEIVWRV